MHPQELWWLIEAKQPKDRKYAGMTEDEVEDLYNELAAQGFFEDNG